MDDISCSEQSELERLRKENREKTKRIEELKAREERFTQQIDKLEGDLLGLKAQFERYCANVRVDDNSSSTSTNPNIGQNCNHSEQQTSQYPTTLNLLCNVSAQLQLQGLVSCLR